MDKFTIMQQCYQDSSLKMSSKLVMQYLVYKSGNHGTCFPSVETIAKELSLSERTIQRHMRILEKAGYLTVRARYMNQGCYAEQLSNSYELNLNLSYQKSGINQATEKERELSEKQKHNSKAGQIKKAGLIKRIFSCPNLKASDKLLLIYLTHKSGKNGVTVKSMEHILEAMNICLKTFFKILKRIVNTGFITARQEGNCLVFCLKEEEKKHQESEQVSYLEANQESEQEAQPEFNQESVKETKNPEGKVLTPEPEPHPENPEPQQEEFLFSIPVLQIIRTGPGRFRIRSIGRGRFRDICLSISGSNRNYRNPVRIRQNIKHYERYLDDS